MLSYDCKNRTCRELYGPKHGPYFDLWCKQCTDMARIGTMKKKKSTKPKVGYCFTE